MGRFIALVCVLGACGDNLESPATPQPTTGTGEATQRPLVAVPQVCGYQAWQSSLDPATPLRLSATARAGGFEVMSAPAAGGPLTGLAVSDSIKFASEQPVPLAGSYSASAVTRVNSYLVAAAVGPNGLAVDVMNDQMQAAIPVARLPGSVVADQAIVDIDGSHAVPYADASGVWLQQFDDQWNTAARLQLASTSPADPIGGVSVTQAGDAAVVGWTTNAGCNLAMVYAFDRPIASAHAAFACALPRLAPDPANGGAVIAFEAADGASIVHSSQMGAVPRLLRPGSTSPRALFDGTHTWLAYLDIHGNPVVGFLAADDELISTALDDIHPQHDGYELVLFQGQPWVIALDATGYTAHRMCVAEE